MKKYIKTTLKSFLNESKNWRQLKGRDMFDGFELTTLSQVEDEVQIFIEDDGVDAHISYNNPGAENMVYLARIDAQVTGGGHGSKFIEKLKKFGKLNGFDGIFLHQEYETESLTRFYQKHGFNKEADGFLYFYF
jgi:hypothetical protein